MPRTTIRSEDITAAQVKTADMAIDPTNATNLTSGDVPLAQLGNVPAQTGLMDDIALLGFKVAANGSLAKYNLDDQTVDAFEDATGVDAGSSTNASRDSLNYYSGVIGVPTGGTKTTYSGYTVHSFLADGTFTTTSSGNVDYLVVAGGGSGGAQIGGGGGAGGYRTATGFALTAQAYSIVVGDGGAITSASSQGIDGDDSSFSTITSAGGGGGGHYAVPSGFAGSAGGSGGGGGTANGAGGAGNTPSTSPSQGNAGGAAMAHSNPYTAGGGGGAGVVGTAGGSGAHGGNGTASSITGASVTRAGGGGGNSHSGTGGTGGTGGGGAGASGTTDSGIDGTVNTGSGGGGREANTGTGGAGGSGIVIISYADGQFTSVSNMVLQSNATTAVTAPTKGDIVMTYTNGIGTATLNTDLTAEFSADNGSNWTSTTLVAQGSTGAHFIVSAHDVTLTSASGTAMKYRIKTLNQDAAKETRIQAVSLGWS